MQKERKIGFDFGEVCLRKNARSRNIRIKVHPEQGVVVSVPLNCPDERAINFVIEKELWIRKSLNKMARTKQMLSVFTEETMFSLFKHTLELKTHAKQSLRLHVTDNRLYVFYPEGVAVTHPKVQEFIRTAILKTMHLEAKAYLPVRTRELAKIHGYSVSEIKVRNNKSRWGSCSSKNNISLNIHLMRLPTALIDYVILHELVHTKIRNHSAHYWKTVEQEMPGAGVLDKKLNKYHLVYW
jgi:predicted metal-dependent hydrolase